MLNPETNVGVIPARKIIVICHILDRLTHQNLKPGNIARFTRCTDKLRDILRGADVTPSCQKHWEDLRLTRSGWGMAGDKSYLTLPRWEYGININTGDLGPFGNKGGRKIETELLQQNLLVLRRHMVSGDENQIIYQGRVVGRWEIEFKQKYGIEFNHPQNLAWLEGVNHVSEVHLGQAALFGFKS